MKIRIEKPILKSLAMMASVIEARDAYTGGHLWRVSQLCRSLAEAAALTADMVFLARLGGFLHDIGKVGIPDNILGKRGTLTPSEFEVVKTHPGIGATLIQTHPLADLTLLAVHQHHERVNGTGYPNKLRSNQISTIAKIVSIADAFDALTSSRPYRRRVGTEAAVAALLMERGSQFDSRLLDIFVGMAENGDLVQVVGNSEPDIPLVKCPTCGPVITISRLTRDGDAAYCRVCGMQHLLNKKEGTFEAEATYIRGSAEQLKPRPELSSLEVLVSEAPGSVRLEKLNPMTAESL